MARRKVPEGIRWQIIGMRNAGLSGHEISRRMEYSPSVINRLFNRFDQTNEVRDKHRSGKARVTSRREAGALKRLVMQIPFANSTILKHRCLPNRHMSTK